MRKQFCLIFSTLFFISTTLLAQGYKLKTIVLDAGHGGPNVPGAAGKKSLEKDIALAVALKLQKKIQSEYPSIKVVQTRKSDVDIDWYKRADIANEANGDIFISIHCNSVATNRETTRGTETFVGAYRRINEMDAALKENQDIVLNKNSKSAEKVNLSPEETIKIAIYKSLFREKSLLLAKLVQKNYTENKMINRGVKEQGLYVLQRVAMPSILTEIGFISHPKEEEYLISNQGQTEIVNAIFEAIKEYKRIVEN
ncbi:MAG: N-acetylmuramoyl-L-alanine amidase [Pedobacter sp.]|nr:MAG: N-acetylmuramoyl-L-alanine amidase [Pedobacter sp.]